MAHFNHAFRKMFLGTGTTRTAGAGGVPDPATPVAPASTGGFITTSGAHTSVLATLGAGYFGFFDKNYEAVAVADLAGAKCCPLYLASAALMGSDKIGKFHGGYKESNKSKLINPRYISKWYRVDDAAAQQQILHVGTTNIGSCDFDFYCDQTYYLRVDVKGEPALQFANRNLYKTLGAYTGCCTGATPALVDSTLVMIEWAKQIMQDPILSQFIKVKVVTEAGAFLETPAAMAAYASPGHTAGTTAGLVLFGAYVDTKFGNCSFQVSDNGEVDPIKIYASMVDMNGDPCGFTGICVEEECEARKGQGYGETVLRDLILSESYLQNHFHSDARIREITQGDDILSAIDRTARYTRYFLLHSVPRFNNPSSTFDTDQYLLEIVVGTAANADLETFVDTWLDNCSDCEQLETHALTACTPDADSDVPTYTEADVVAAFG